MCKKSGFICGLFVGAIAGSAVGFLCAPESGEETRSKIKESTQDALGGITGQLDAYTGGLKKYLDEFTSGLTGKFQDYKDQLEDKIQDFQNEVNADIAELNEELEQLHNEEEIQRQNLAVQETDADEKND